MFGLFATCLAISSWDRNTLLRYIFGLYHLLSHRWRTDDKLYTFGIGAWDVVGPLFRYPWLPCSVAACCGVVFILLTTFYAGYGTRCCWSLPILLARGCFDRGTWWRLVVPLCFLVLLLEECCHLRPCLGAPMLVGHMPEL